MKRIRELQAIDRQAHSRGIVRPWLAQEMTRRAMVRMAQQAKEDGTRDAQAIESQAFNHKKGV